MAKRKAANGSGCIRQRNDGTWEAIVTVGRDPGTGKLIRKSYYGKTQAEVRKKLTASARDLDEGTYTEPSKMTVGQWLDVWAAEYLGSTKPLTVSKYKTQIRVHLKPAFGAIRLHELTAPMIQTLYNRELKKPKGLSPKSICNLHGVLHKALSQAVKLGYIKFNPCDACELPRVEKPQIQPIEGDLVSRFLEAVKGSEYEALYIVTMFTGMRQGEVLGLTWDCVDFDNETVTVAHQLQKERIEGGGGRYRLVSLKNDNVRTVAPAAYVFDTLRRVRIQQNEHRLMFGADWQNELNLVFTHENGEHLSANTIYECFKRVVKGLGIASTRFHDLRHTFATLSLQNGDDIKTVSQNLGHATVAFTLDVYGHVTQQMKKDSAARMQAFIETVK